MKKVNPDNSKTIYVGGVYEVDKTSGGSVTRTVTYYPAAGAMRINSTLYYILKDHLGSASVVTDASGNILGENRYYPFGETRVATGSILTDRLFTGQREMTGLGIYHYGARFYSPKLGRFLSPDSIVPGYANPQNLNRFSYTLNNPLRYTDPTGHKVCEGQDNDCKGWMNVPSSPALARQILTRSGVRLSGTWEDRNIIAAASAVVAVGTKFASERGNGESASAAFRAVYDHINFQWEGGAGMCGKKAASSGGCTDGAHQIRFWSLSGHMQNDMTRMVKNVVHELGHAFDWTHYNPDDLTRASDHMSGDFTRDTVLRPNKVGNEIYPDHRDWQQSLSDDSNEIFADMFTARTFGAWNTDPENATTVNAAQGWMNGLVP